MGKTTKRQKIVAVPLLFLLGSFLCCVPTSAEQQAWSSLMRLGTTGPWSYDGRRWSSFVRRI